MNGKLYQKSLSKAYPIEKVITEIAILLIIGAFAIFLRANLRIPINMPGHHGLEVMALFLLGRQFTKINMASTISSVAASIFILFPVMGFKDPFLPAIYLVMGIGIDVLYRFYQKVNGGLLLYAVLGGIAYMLIPLSRLVIHFTTGHPYQLFIKSGYVLPVISHFVFGAAGAILAFVLYKASRKE